MVAVAERLSVANIDTPLQLSEKVLIWEGPTDPLGNLPYINLLTKRGFVKKTSLALAIGTWPEIYTYGRLKMFHAERR